MIHSIIGSSVVNKNYTSGMVLLKAIFDVLGQVECLACARSPRTKASLFGDKMLCCDRAESV